MKYYKPNVTDILCVIYFAITTGIKSKKISNDQELIQSDPISALIEGKVSINYTTRYECRSTNDLQYSIEKVSRDRNIEK